MMHRSSDDEEWDLLARHLSGEATPSDEEKYRAWVEGDPDRRRMVESLSTVWDLSAGMRPGHRGDRERVWDRIKAHIDASPDGAVPARAGVGRAGARHPVATRGWSSYLLLVAAALALLVLVPTAGPRVADFARERLLPTPAREYLTGKGERLRVTLKDGSIIELGASSRLSVPVRFPAASREVRLAGVALFEVAHDRERPFLVHAGDAVTRVLGTRFVIRAFSDEAGVRVAVLQGRVALRSRSEHEGRGTALDPGQVGELGPDGVTSVVQDAVKFQRLVGWTAGRLEFRDEPLVEVLKELALWHDVGFEVTDADLAAQRISTVVEGDSLDHVLRAIALVLEAHYERIGEKIVFSKE